jgi:hypothetical protein
MLDKNSESQPEQPGPELSGTSQIPAQPEPVAISDTPEKPRLGRLRRLIRIVLIWLVVLSIGFLAGLETDQYLRYKPLSKAIGETQTALDQANQQISNMQAEIDKLTAANVDANVKITSLEGENKTLQDKFKTSDAHLKLLQILVDVSNARLALFLNDVEGAKAALTNTPQRLDNLLPFISTFDANLAKSMPQRLNLIVSGLDRDTETVKIDLELFSKDLLEIEAAMFGG